LQGQGQAQADSYRALKAPGWKKEWHVGVRATASGKLVAFISGIPIQMRVRNKVLNCSEVNFLCVHKKLRSKRLAPVLIKEITRRCYVEGTFQAVYTVGSLLPTPVSTARYFHRAIHWEKLYDVGFSPLPHGSTKQRQIIRYKLPDTTSTPGLREMEAKDVDATLSLLQRYLERMDMAQVFNKTEFEHWMAPKEKPKEQVVWSYVVEDPDTHKITDYFSFYNLESTVIGNKKHDTIKAAYLFYYATEVAFEKNDAKLKQRLNSLMKDALILAKKVSTLILHNLYAATNMCRLILTSSTPSRCSITRCSWKNNASVLETAHYITTSTITVLRRSLAASTRGTRRARIIWVALDWSCCNHFSASQYVKGVSGLLSKQISSIPHQNR
jgi:glycylpeptide N-tetradecanoyltransferase